MKTHWNMIVLAGCCLTLLASGCEQKQPDTRAADEREIRKVDSAGCAAVQAKDLDGFISNYAPDASYFPLNSPIVTGLDSIRKLWAQNLASIDLASWKTDRVEVSRAGDIAYSFGTNECTYTNTTGKVITIHGKFLSIWKKQPDGKWKVIADMNQFDSPATPPPSQ